MNTGNIYLELVASTYWRPRYCRAARKKKWLPIYFLICQSLELSLKSFLAERGYDKGRLKKLGHDLMKCLDQAGRNGLEFSLSQERTNEMERISAYYAGKHLEYFFKQEKAFPNLEDIMSFVKILRVNIFNSITIQEFNEMR
jgi:HEPN domain-containing protein